MSKIRLNFSRRTNVLILPVLRQDSYLRTWRGLGLIRIALVVIIICGAQTVIMVSTIVDYKADALADDYVKEFNNTNQTSQAIAWQLRSACVLQAPIPNPPDLILSGILPAIFWGVAAWTYYANILIKTFSNSKRIHASSIFYRLILWSLGKYEHDHDLASFDAPDRRLKMWEALIDKTLSRHLERIYRIIEPADLAYFALKSSVSADMPWLLFVLVYSAGQIHFNWLDKDSPFWTYRLSTSGFGFGQTLALVLLLLPGLALAKPVLRM